MTVQFSSWNSQLTASSVIDPAIVRRAKWRNALNTWMIMVGITFLLAASAWALFGTKGIIWAIILGIALSTLPPRVSPAMVLRFFKSQPLGPKHAPELNRILIVLAKRAELPSVPKLYYIASSNMNAFAVGRPDESAITVTDGLLRGLHLRQLTGVLAHEVSHIANDDLRVMGLADMAGRLTNAMQSLGLLLIIFGLWQGGGFIGAAIVLMLAPTIGTLLQLALSRSREYDADLEAVQLTGDPEGLASALIALQQKQGNVWESVVVPGGRTPNPSLLRTHPRTTDRVARLQQLRTDRPDDLQIAEHEIALPAAFRRVLRAPQYHYSGYWF